MIVTVTMNPAIDKSTTLDKMIPEKKLRCTELIIEAGGGGINVSKAINELGGTSRAIFTAGGDNGKLLQQIMAGKQIKFENIPAPIVKKLSTLGAGDSILPLTYPFCICSIAAQPSGVIPMISVATPSV